MLSKYSQIEQSTQVLFTSYFKCCICNQKFLDHISLSSLSFKFSLDKLGAYINKKSPTCIRKLEK